MYACEMSIEPNPVSSFHLIWSEKLKCATLKKDIPPDEKSSLTLTLILIGIGVFVMIIIGLIIYFVRRRKRMN